MEPPVRGQKMQRTAPWRVCRPLGPSEGELEGQGGSEQQTRTRALRSKLTTESIQERDRCHAVARVILDLVAAIRIGHVTALDVVAHQIAGPQDCFAARRPDVRKFHTIAVPDQSIAIAKVEEIPRHLQALEGVPLPT